MAPYDPKAIANRFIALADADGKKLTPMQLLKLVYFAHGWHLALTEKALIAETVEAWKFGPVIPSLYHEFKEFGTKPITRKAKNWQFDIEELLQGKEPASESPEIDQQDAYAEELIKRVWEIYGQRSGPQLSALTHQAGTPWAKTVDAMKQFGGGFINHYDIGNDVIRDHFKEKLRPVTA